MPTPVKRKRVEVVPILDDSPSPAASKAKKAKISYTTQQKTAIAQLQGATGLDKTSAAKVLKQHNWNVEFAANAYFGGGSNTAANPHKSTLTKLFDSYRDDPKNEPDEINIEGTMKMLGDMDISPEDVAALIFSEMVKSPSLGKLEREGFVDGLSQVGVSDLSKIGSTINQRRSQLAQSSFRPTFKNIYRHTFILARAQGQKALPLEMAAEYWRLLFTSPSLEWKTASSPWLDWWIEFLETSWKKSVNKDMWDQTLTFAEKCLDDESLSWWSEDSAWPGVIDEFVEFVQKEKRGGEAMEVE